jgi:hypothetical protein
MSTKTIKLILVIAGMLMASNVSVTAAQGSKSSKSQSPRAVVASLYRQHKTRSPFFQTRSRALLDKYFAKELADLFWQDAHSSSGEVGALDGDPLFNAQDMEIKKFSIQDGIAGPEMTEVPVTFENFGEKHVVKFRLVPVRAGWKIANIVYDDGSSLLEILKTDRDSAERNQSIKIYLVAVGDDGKSGKKIGCSDSLVAVTRTIKKTSAPLTAAIGELLQTPQHPDATPKLENFWKGRNLKVKSVVINNHTATIYLTGAVFVAGICDEPRIESQIEATALQFSNVEKVRVFLGKRTLADAIR